MIKLTCTNCQTVLEIDDAFAGGVCRCQHCGAIQTVPSHLKTPKAKSPRTLYAKTGKDEATPSSGLDDLANVVSSGLTSGRLRAGAKQKSKNLIALWVVIGMLLAIGIGAIVWINSHNSSIPQAGPSGPGPVPLQTIPTETDTGPNFCGAPLNVPVTVYVLDRGSGTADLFSYLKQAAYNSIQSLGPDRKFQIIFWFNGSDDAFPSAGPTNATPQSLELARRALDGIFAHGQSDVQSAMAKAIDSHPDVIVLATGKGLQLDDDFAQQILKIRGDSPVKIDTFDLSSGPLSPALATIAQKTGGESHLVPEGELKRYTKQER